MNYKFKIWKYTNPTHRKLIFLCKKHILGFFIFFLVIKRFNSGINSNIPNSLRKLSFFVKDKFCVSIHFLVNWKYFKTVESAKTEHLLLECFYRKQFMQYIFKTVTGVSFLPYDAQFHDNVINYEIMKAWLSIWLLTFRGQTGFLKLYNYK